MSTGPVASSALRPSAQVCFPGWWCSGAAAVVPFTAQLHTARQGAVGRERGGQSLQAAGNKKWTAGEEKPLGCYQIKCIIYYFCSFFQQEWLSILDITLSSSLTSLPILMNLSGHSWTKLSSLTNWLMCNDNPFLTENNLYTHSCTSFSTQLSTVLCDRSTSCPILVNSS